MRMTFRLSPPVSKGYALIIVMTFLGVALLVLGSVMYWTTSNSTEIKRNNSYFTSQAAAEAAVEQTIANMNRDYLYQSLNSSNNYTSTTNLSQTGWPVTFTFRDPINNLNNETYVYIPSITSALTPLTSQESGLQGYIRSCTVTSTATPSNQLYAVPATVTEKVQYADIPVFQFAIFYNMVLEFAPANAMTIIGPVFSNDGIWARAGSTLTFNQPVSSASNITTTAIDTFCSSYNKGGNAPTFNSSTNMFQPSLTMPIGAGNVETILQFPPSTPVDYSLGSSGAYTTNGQTYLANQADLIITNTTAGGASISVYWQDGNHSPAITSVPDDYYIISNKTTNAHYPTNTVAGLSATWTNLYSGYSFVTNNSFYDYRESDLVQAIQINVTNLGVWAASAAANGGSTINSTINTDKGHQIDGIYVYNSVPLSGSVLPGVTVVNGAQLPSSSGLAIATPQPLYVVGNYNVQQSSANPNGSAATTDTTYTYPAALYGDSLTLLATNFFSSLATLSSSWTSSGPTPTYGSTPNRPVTGVMTVNAAALVGIVPSTSANYSGGVENYLRLLQNWGAQNLWYNGSIVCMFPSVYATNLYVNVGTSSSYYSAPTRQWSFDPNFANGKLPPMTPRVKAIIRLGWVP
jgi:hypothetical protein